MTRTRWTQALLAAALLAGCGGNRTTVGRAAAPAEPAPPAAPSSLHEHGAREIGVYKCDCKDERQTWTVAAGDAVVCGCGAKCPCDHGPLGHYTVRLTSPTPPHAGTEGPTFEMTCTDADGKTVALDGPQLLLCRPGATADDREVVEIASMERCPECGAQRVDLPAAAAGTYVVEVSLTLPGTDAESTALFPVTLE